MKNGRLVQKIRNMIAAGDLDAAVTSLFHYSMSIGHGPLQDRILILTGRYRKLEQMMQNDLIDLSFASSSKGRMKKEVLEILDQLEHVEEFSAPTVELVLEDEQTDLSADRKAQLVHLVSEYLKVDAAEVRLGNAKRG